MKLSFIVRLFIVAVICQKAQARLPFLSNPMVQGNNTVYTTI